MKKAVIVTLLLFCCAANAAIPIPTKKPQIPQIDVEKALPPELEAEKIAMPEKIPSEKTPMPEPQPVKLCNAEVLDKLAVGTRVFIRIFGHDDISRETLVGPKGTVSIPMVGEVFAEGETAETLATRISEKLETAYIISQGVDVEIVQYPPIYVIGLVGKPGLYDYRPRLNVRQAVALAGGFNPRARTSKVRILRGSGLIQEEYSGDEDTQILPGDTVEVLRRWF